MKKIIVFTLFTLLSFSSFSQSKLTLSSDSKIGFGIVKFKIGGVVEGEFKKFSGTGLYNKKTNLLEKLSSSIEVSSVDTGNKDRDAHLQTHDFFDAKNHPQITFKSSGSTKLVEGASLKGQLKIRGVSKNVSLKISKVKKSQSSISFEAKTTINRLDYGVSWNKTMEKSAWKKVLGFLGKTVLSENVELKLTLKSTL